MLARQNEAGRVRFYGVDPKRAELSVSDMVSRVSALMLMINWMS